MKKAALVKVLTMLLLATGGLLSGPETTWGVVEWSGELWSGYRQDQFDFNISGGPGGPDILSELTWEDLQIVQLGIDAGWRFKPRRSPVGALVQFEGSYGNIIDGSNEDSDYEGDSRTQEFSRSNNEADGDVWDISIGAGPQFTLFADRLRISPLLGYAWHAQNLNITDGYQTIDTVGNEIGPFSGLDSSYDALWYGFWTGVASEWRPLRTVALNCSLQFHEFDYKAEADWNLRDDLAHPKSFEQWASGDGIQGSAGVALQLPRRWRLHLDYYYRRWQADGRGLHRAYIADGTLADTGLNEVNWESQSLFLGLQKTW
jgi:hypothetical protein